MIYSFSFSLGIKFNLFICLKKTTTKQPTGAIKQSLIIFVVGGWNVVVMKYACTCTCEESRACVYHVGSIALLRKSGRYVVVSRKM